MKKIFSLVAVACMATVAVMAQEKKEDGYKFTDQKILKYTPVQNQASSGTCWSFSGTAFLESEILRLKGEEVNLSEMYIVRCALLDKADKYVRMHGKVNFSAGGATHDVMNAVKKYGALPEEVYTGLNYGTTSHRHAEMEKVLEGYLNGIIENPNKTLSTAWRPGFEAVLDAYLGKVPEKFSYKGKEYTPETFAQLLGLNMDDYISFTSFTHHPFYEQFAVEVPDNWAWGLSYNVPIDEFAELFSNAINNGFTIYWASDVSEKGFAYNKGFAVIPDADITIMSDSEKSRWTALTDGEKERELYKLDRPGAEKKITQELRQVAFDNYETTDDHGMQIVGTATDQIGNKYYKVKNSWGTEQVYGGFFYASEPFVLYKTTNMVIHKDAIPKSILKKLTDKAKETNPLK